jgi:anti-sigma regulatory factor (Ser/Thr protein kinase)
MPTQPCNVVRIQLSCDRAAPRRAREALTLLDGIDVVREEARLVTTELVANAVLHGGGGPDDEIELVAERVPAGIRIAVIDRGGSDTEPHLSAKDPRSGEGGLGLRLVESLSQRWGIERLERLRVWAELAA